MDLQRQLKSAMGSGQLLFGQKQTNDACARGDAKLVILAANCPLSWIDDLHARHPDIAKHRVGLVNRELGTACAKPFSISAICVVEAGNSELLNLRSNID
jgi:large subunit ribosomal protein L30e